MGKQSARPLRDLSREREREREEEEAIDAFDVPAAVLCAFCGEADCAGCTAADDQASGLVTIVPWERPGAGLWPRLWSTARATTQGAETFFATLPDGPVSPAIRFALLAEVLAVLSLAALVLPLAAMASPRIAAEIVGSPAARSTAFRWLALGIPALSAWMVAAHASHGLALDIGATRQGARSQRTRALRFGLYACGWDLMTGPLGGLVMLVGRGLSATSQLFGLSMRVPGKASVALLQGVYGLGGDKVSRARRAGSLTAIAIALLTALGILVVVSLAV